MAELLALTSAQITRDPLDDIDAELRAENGDARYIDGRIRFDSGDESGNLPVKEPGFDAEVIYHEFVHALLHTHFPHIFEVFKNEQHTPELAIKSLDEGVAYYLACVVFADPQWAEYAYGHEQWLPLRDLSAAPVTFENVQFGPESDIEHTLGMWWARIFWKIRGRFGNNAMATLRFNRILLRTFHASSGLTLDPGSEPDRFRRAQRIFGKFGDTLVATADGTPERTIIRQVLLECEIPITSAT